MPEARINSILMIPVAPSPPPTPPPELPPEPPPAPPIIPEEWKWPLILLGVGGVAVLVIGLAVSGKKK